jgi:hypothetical protein
VDDGEAEKALDDFEAEWGQKYPSIAPSWQRAWQEVIPFFTQNGSIDDPFQPHGLNPIHRVSDTPVSHHGAYFPVYTPTSPPVANGPNRSLATAPDAAVSFRFAAIRTQCKKLPGQFTAARNGDAVGSILAIHTRSCTTEAA